VSILVWSIVHFRPVKIQCDTSFESATVTARARAMARATAVAAVAVAVAVAVADSNDVSQASGACIIKLVPLLLAVTFYLF
jgi:hypothetical protein